MIRNKLVEDQTRRQRLDAKSLDNLFRRRIEAGANCAPFVSGAILQTVKDVYPLSPDDADNAVGLGRIKLLVVAADEPAAKPMAQCQKVNLLKEAGFDTSPKRGKGTWSEFLERHRKALWASDFLSVKSMTAKGFVDLFVLFFIHPGTRRVIVSGITTNPNSAWMKQQARNVTGEIRDLGFPAPEILIIDHDTKYTREFDAIFESEGTEVKRVGPIAPNLNAYAERFAQTLRVECMDHFVVCGEKHLRHNIAEFLVHYHDERPHQNLGNAPPCWPSEETVPFVKDQPIHRTERLGGLLKHYSRKAA